MLLLDTEPPQNMWLQLGIGGACLLVVLLLGLEAIKQYFATTRNSKTAAPPTIEESMKTALSLDVIPYLDRLCNIQEQIAQTQKDLTERKLEETKILIKLSVLIENISYSQQNIATKNDVSEVKQDLAAVASQVGKLRARGQSA